MGKLELSKNEDWLLKLEDNDIRYICRWIDIKNIRNYFKKAPKEFSKICPGFRPMSLSNNQIIKLVCKNKEVPFIWSFIMCTIQDGLKQFKDCRKDMEENGMSAEESLLSALPDSFFSGNVDLFFKLQDKDYTDEYIVLVKTALSLLKRQPDSIKEESDSIKIQLEKELSAVKKQNDELCCELSQLQQNVEAEKTLYSKTCQLFNEAELSNAALQQQLKETSSKNRLLKEKINLMQIELDRFYQLSNYMDKNNIQTDTDEYQYTSVCKVFWDYGKSQFRLLRLADIKNGEISLFIKDEQKPPYFENRDKLFFKNESEKEGYIGVWNWNAGPSKTNPSVDYITSEYNNDIKMIEIIKFSDCHTYEDIAHTLISSTFQMIPESKILFVCKEKSGQIIGLLCKNKDFEVNNGIAKLKSTIYQLPEFEISADDILKIGEKRVYKSIELGVPKGILQTRKPLSIVKDIVIKRAKNSVFRQQGLSKKEAQHCQEFLKNLPTQTMVQEIANSLLCSEDEANQYISTFIEQTNLYLSKNDADIKTLSAALNHNTELLVQCKEILSEEWEKENAKKLTAAQKQLKEIEHTVFEQNEALNNLANEYKMLQDKMTEITSNIDAKIQLADEVEVKIAQRIDAARKNAADFICETAFSISAPVSYEYTKAPSNTEKTNLFKRHIDVVEGENISDSDDFIDELADNLITIGYDDTTAVHMAELITFCIIEKMPIICGENAVNIADCISAMFGNTDTYIAILSINQTDCFELCESIKSVSANNKCVIVINGIFDSLSLHMFNEIIMRSEECNNSVVLIFALNGAEVSMIPCYVWNRAMFIDGDMGRINQKMGNIAVHTTDIEFDIISTLDNINEKKKQMKPFSDIISNTAILNYARFLTATQSSLQENTQILTQIALYAMSYGKQERMLEKLQTFNMNIKVIKDIKKFLGEVE